MGWKELKRVSLSVRSQRSAFINLGIVRNFNATPRESLFQIVFGWNSSGWRCDVMPAARANISNTHTYVHAQHSTEMGKCAHRIKKLYGS
jgi:hypothetical protein